MANRRQQGRPQRPSWSMFPSLDNDVSQLLAAENQPFTFYNIDNDNGCIRSHDTNIMGRFHCTRKSCHTNGWSSKKIAITIRMYSDRRYNARVYHQRCQACNALSKPILDHSYAERVAYRLLKWCGVEQEVPAFAGGASRGPHQTALCEGCRAGHCRESSGVDGLVGRLTSLSLAQSSR